VFKKYLAVMLFSIKTSLAYLGEILYGVSFLLVVLFIFCSLWRAAYAQGRTLQGMDYRQTVWYLLMAESIVLSLNPVYQLMSNEVKSGELVYKLLRPIDYLFYEFCWGLGASLTRFAMNFIAGMLLVLVLVGSIAIDWIFIPLCLLSIVLAFAIDYCLSVLIGLSAFITEDATGIAFIYQKIVFVLGGVVIPLSFFPPVLRRIAESLPFAAIGYAPARILINFSFVSDIAILLVQLSWFALLSVPVIICYRLSLRHLVINGG